METLTRSAVDRWWEAFTQLSEQAGTQWLERIQRTQPALWSFVTSALREQPRLVQEQGMLLFLATTFILENGIGDRLPRVMPGPIATLVPAKNTQLSPYLGDRIQLRQHAVMAGDHQFHLKDVLADVVLGGDSDLPLADRERGRIFLLLTTAIDALEHASSPTTRRR